MKILLLIVIISFLLIFFPQGSLGAVIELLSAGADIFFKIVPMLVQFIKPVMNAFFSTRYLISLVSFFIFSNLLVILIRFIKGQAVTGFNEGLEEAEKEDKKLQKANDDVEKARKEVNGG